MKLITYLFCLAACFFAAWNLSAQEDIQPNQTRAPYVGEKRGLVLRIQFKDDPFSETMDTERFNTFFNGDFWSPNQTATNITSVKNYYTKASAGKLNLTHEITPLIQLSKTKDEYMNATVYEILKDAITQLQTDSPDYFSQERLNAYSYDVGSGDGLFYRDESGEGKYIFSIDPVSIIYAGEMPAFAERGTTFYPHMGFLVSQNYNRAIPLGEVNGHSIGLRNYQITPEKFGGRTELALGVVAHEIGHSCGFEDYYDLNDYTSGLGAHCMMSYPNDFTPPPFNPYSQWMAQWIEFKTLPVGQTVTMNPNEVYIRVNPNNQQEFFIFENRHKVNTELTCNLPSQGLAVWHVDLSKSANRGSQPYTPSYENHYRLALVQANGNEDFYVVNKFEKYKGGADDYFGTNYTEFSDITTPSSNYWNGLPSGIKLKNINYNATTGAITFESLDAYSTGTFQITSAEFDKTSIAEGGEAVRLTLHYTGAKTNDLLKFYVPANTLMLAENETSTRTLNQVNGTASFLLQSIPYDAKRNTALTVSQLSFSIDDNIFTCTPETNLQITEGTPEIKFTITPSVRIVENFYNTFNVTVVTENALGLSYNENYLKLLSGLTSDGWTISQGTSTTTPSVRISNKVESIIKSVDMQVGSGGTVSGIPTRTISNIKLAHPIVCTNTPEKMFVVDHAPLPSQCYQSEICGLEFLCYNVTIGKSLNAPDLGAQFVLVGTSTYTFTENADVAKVVFYYKTQKTGTTYSNPAATLTYSDGTYQLPAGVITALARENDTPIPTTINLTVSPRQAAYEINSELTFSATLETTDTFSPTRPEIIISIYKDDTLLEINTTGIWTTNLPSENYKIIARFAGDDVWAPSEETFTFVVTQDMTPGSKFNPLPIASADDLYNFAQKVNTGDSDLYATLTQDITITDMTHFPLSLYSGTFSGGTNEVFHTLTFESANRAGTNATFISKTEGATLQNLNINVSADQNYTVESSNNCGAAVAIAQPCNTQIHNVHLKVESTLQNVASQHIALGALLGQTTGTIQITSSDVTLKNNAQMLGNCYTGNSGESKNLRIGLFAGVYESKNNAQITLENCCAWMQEGSRITPSTHALYYFPDYKIGTVGFSTLNTILTIRNFYAEIAGSIEAPNITPGSSKFDLCGFVPGSGGNFSDIVVNILPTGKLGILSDEDGYVQTRTYGLVRNPNDCTLNHCYYIHEGTSLTPTRALAAEIPTYAIIGIKNYSSDNVFILNRSRSSEVTQVGETLAFLQNSDATATLNALPTGMSVNVSQGTNRASLINDNTTLSVLSAGKVTLCFSKESMRSFNVEYTFNAPGLPIIEVTPPTLHDPEQTPPSKDKISLSWEPNEGVWIRVLRASAPEGPWEIIAENLEGNSFDDTRAVPGKRYYYKIEAVSK